MTLIYINKKYKKQKYIIYLFLILYKFLPELCRTPLFYNIIHWNYGNLNKKYMHFYYIDKIISQKNIFFTLKFLDGGHRIKKKTYISWKTHRHTPWQLFQIYKISIKNIYHFLFISVTAFSLSKFFL